MSKKSTRVGQSYRSIDKAKAKKKNKFPRYTSGVTEDGRELYKFVGPTKSQITVSQKTEKNKAKRLRKLAA